jgi:hypothetical protein
MNRLLSELAASEDWVLFASLLVACHASQIRPKHLALMRLAIYMGAIYGLSQRWHLGVIAPVLLLPLEAYARWLQGRRRAGALGEQEEGR